jgi:hypothetical protein
MRPLCVPETSTFETYKKLQVNKLAQVIMFVLNFIGARFEFRPEYRLF